MGSTRLYLRVSATCLILLLVLLAVDLISPLVLPRLNASPFQSDSCYGTFRDHLPSVICGRDVAFPISIGFHLGLWLFLLLVFPPYIMYLPPQFWLAPVWFLLLAISYPFCRKFRKSPPPKQTQELFRLFNWTSAIAAIIAIVGLGLAYFQNAYTNLVYFAARTDLLNVHSTVERMGDRLYQEAMRRAVNRGELDIVQKLFRPGYAWNDLFLNDAVQIGTIKPLETVKFFVENGVPLTKFHVSVAAKSFDNDCEDSRTGKKEVLAYLLSKRGQATGDMLWDAGIELCYPAAKILLDSGADPFFQAKTVKPIEELIKDRPFNSSRKLSKQSLEEQLAYKQQMIDLIIEYRQR